MRVNVTKRGKVYQYKFEIAKINGKRKFINKSGFRTKNEAYIAGMKAYDEYINGGVNKRANMTYTDYLDYWMSEYFEINYKYSTAKRYKETFKAIKAEYEAHSGTDIIKYPFKIFHQELKINCSLYDLKGIFITISLRNEKDKKNVRYTGV